MWNKESLKLDVTEIVASKKKKISYPIHIIPYIPSDINIWNEDLIYRKCKKERQSNDKNFTVFSIISVNVGRVVKIRAKFGFDYSSCIFKILTFYDINDFLWCFFTSFNNVKCDKKLYTDKIRA